MRFCNSSNNNNNNDDILTYTSGVVSLSSAASPFPVNPTPKGPSNSRSLICILPINPG